MRGYTIMKPIFLVQQHDKYHNPMGWWLATVFEPEHDKKNYICALITRVGYNIDPVIYARNRHVHRVEGLKNGEITDPWVELSVRVCLETSNA